jgi:hypothetical protein
MLDNENFTVHEEKPDHHFRTELPHILDELPISIYAYRVYAKIKKHAGDEGYCSVSIPRIAKEINCSEKKVREGKRELEQPFSLLDGKPLIRVTKRPKVGKNHETDLITIVPIWRDNGDYCRSNYNTNKKVPTGSPQEPPLVPHRNHPGSPQEPKEEPLNKNPLKRDNVSPQREKKKTFKLSLSPEQRNAFDKVMSHPFKWCDKPKENDVCAWMLSMKISPERIISALKLLTQDTRDAERTHRKIDNEVGSLLTIARSKQERVLRNDDFEFNKAHASRSSKINRFLNLTRDYVTIAVGHATENLMFNLPKGTFITTLDCYIRQAKAQEA